jgi:hypothetical protein
LDPKIKYYDYSYNTIAIIVTNHFYNDLKRLVGATMGTPADVVKARIMNQPTDEHGRGK